MCRIFDEKEKHVSVSKGYRKWFFAFFSLTRYLSACCWHPVDYGVLLSANDLPFVCQELFFCRCSICDSKRYTHRSVSPKIKSQNSIFSSGDSVMTYVLSIIFWFLRHRSFIVGQGRLISQPLWDMLLGNMLSNCFLKSYVSWKTPVVVVGHSCLIRDAHRWWQSVVPAKKRY